MLLGEICSNFTEGIFFIHPQVLDGARKNVFRYDGSASGRMFYNWNRDYNPTLGRYVQSDPTGLGGGFNTYSYVKSQPTIRMDTMGLRDVIVAVWTSNLTGYVTGDGSVGHVFLGELDGSTITSQFPTPHGMEGANTTLTWLDTLAKEAREPDGVYEVHVPDDAAFDVAAAAMRNAARWSFWPNGTTSTHCAAAATTALNAGGVSVPRPTNPSLPNQVNFDLWLQSHFNSSITQLPRAPW